MIVGIDLGGTNIRIGQLSDGQLINKITAASPAGMELKQSLKYMIDTIAPMITPQVQGIGIGVPSVVDIEKGIVYNVANIPAWEEVHLKDLLEQTFGIPVIINNDSNCFALGEKRFGYGKQYKNMIGVTLGTGVGTGVIIDDELYNGSNTGAGEIGCLPYLDGVYEDYCGSGFFSSFHHTTGRDAAVKAEQGDAEALNIWKMYGDHVGNLIQAILFAYDPDAIIFGGGITDAFPLFSKSMYENLRSFPYPKSLENLVIKVSTDNDMAILGAAALVSCKSLIYT